MNGKILVVEDEVSIQKILAFEIQQAGFEVDLASDGQIGFEKAKTDQYDVIILDVMLPKKDGFTVCRELRSLNIDTHIILLSARDTEFDRVLGLDTGADDYMVKPFSVREVASKIKAVMRRKGNTKQQQTDLKVVSTPHRQQLTYKSMVVDLDKFEVKVEGEPLEFTLKEYELLTFMIQNKGRVVSRDLLLDQLWGMTFYGGTRVVDVHLFKLREKLKAYGISFKTVRGVGYLLEDDAL
ncbi:MAG: response regulator transcription factor [Defluviitaleaceae bacterium]|nr:response regulator transcription factor [Defluviitaleaceae bacterium]